MVKTHLQTEKNLCWKFLKNTLYKDKKFRFKMSDDSEYTPESIALSVKGRPVPQHFQEEQIKRVNTETCYLLGW